MQYKTNINIIFSVFGSPFDPYDFTKSIDIAPTNLWIEGEFIPNNKMNKKREESAWEYSIHSHTMFFEDVSEKIIAIFKNKIENINDYINKADNLMIKFDVVLEIEEAQGVALYFNRNFLNIVNKLNAEVDVDTYILRNE